MQRVCRVLSVPIHHDPTQAGYFDLACNSQPLPAADLVLAADVLYLSELTRSVASRIAEARARGSLVLLTALVAGRKKAGSPVPGRRASPATPRLRHRPVSLPHLEHPSMAWSLLPCPSSTC